jgi:hypothetical protein
MASAKNGRSADVLDLGQTVGERLEVTVNGKHLKAWVTTNQRYPASVAAQLDDARDRWLRKRERIFDEGDPPRDLLEASRELATQLKESDSELPGSAALAPLLARIRTAIEAYDDEARWRMRAVDWEDFVTDSLTILIPHLEDWEADLLPLDVRQAALVRLGWINPSASADAEAAASDELPPEEGPDSTGAEPVPSLPASTT